MRSDFKSINQPFSNNVFVNGKTYLYFGGTAYLGIPQNQDFINLYLEGIKKFGLNNGTSRSNNIQLGIYNEAEKVAAERFHAPDALITSSGYLAAQLTVNALAFSGKVIYAPATHPALWTNHQPQSSKSFSDWNIGIIEEINSSEENNFVLISNSMNNLFPEIYDFNFLKDIHSNKKITLIVDDSHGIGINNNGKGAFATLPKAKNMECVVVASMAKALGVDAGVVLASKKIIEQLKKTNAFLGASPPAAAGIYAFINAEEIYKYAWQKLQKNIVHFSDALNLMWRYEPGFPAFFLNNPNLADDLIQEDVLISSFPYPTPDSEPINRVVISSWHDFKDITRIISVLK